MFSKDIPSEVVANEKRNANDYLELEAKTKDGLRNQYESIRQVLEAMPQTKVLVPGNWDCHCMDDSLAQFNLHNRANKNFKVNGVHFIGYGGSEDCPIEMPEEWLIPFNDGEAYRHLTKESEKDDATIALVHCPVAGYAGNGSRGSYALRAFMNLRHPDLILQGHTHKTLMAKDKETGTIISNPGNLGRYANHEFGTLAEIEYNDETGIVTPLHLWKIEGEHDAQRFDIKLAS